MSKQAKIDVILNSEQAKSALRDIQEQLKQVKILRDKAAAEGDVKGYNQLNTELKKLTTEAGKFTRETLDVNSVLKNLSSASIREINAAYQQMNRELKDMKRNDPGYADKQRQLKSLKDEMNSARKSTSIWSGGIDAAYGKMLLYGAAITGVFYSIKKLYDAAEEQRVADRRLLFAVRGNIDAFQQLKEQADSLQKITGIDDAVISQIQMLGVSTGKSTADVKKITEAAIELSSVTGKDLQDSYMALNKTLVGQMDKTLPKLDGDFKNLTETQLRNGAAIDMVLEKYKGTAAESATEISKMKAAWSEFEEALGGGTTGPLNWVIVKLTSLLGVLKDVTEVFFSFGGSRNAWEAQKEGIQTTAISVSNFRKEMVEAQKDEKRWNLIKKNGVEALNKDLETQKKLLDETKSKIDKSFVAMRNDGAGGITSKEMDDLKVKQQYEQANVNTLKSKLSILKELIDPEKESNNTLVKSKDIAIALKDAFAELAKKISDYDIQINNAVAQGNYPLVEKLNAEKNAAELLLETYKRVKEAIAQGWNMNQRDQGAIDKLVGIGENIVTSNDTPKSPLIKRQFDNKLSGPPEQVQIDEKNAKEKIESIKEQSFQLATDLNNAIFTMVTNHQQAEFNQKMNALDKQREKELSNINLTAQQRDEVTKLYDERSRKLKADQFEKEKKAAIIQTIINGAVAVAKTMATFGWPLGLIPAAFQAASTLAQIAIIESQKPPEFYEGGFTYQDINDRKPVGVVHANEFVASAEAVKNPNLRKIFDVVDYAQRTGTVNGLNLSVLEANTGKQGFKSGGYSDTIIDHSVTNQPGVRSNRSNESLSTEALAITREIAKEIAKEFQNGIKGKWVLNDLEKIQKDKRNLESSVDM